MGLFKMDRTLDQLITGITLIGVFGLGVVNPVGLLVPRIFFEEIGIGSYGPEVKFNTNGGELVLTTDLPFDLFEPDLAIVWDDNDSNYHKFEFYFFQGDLTIDYRHSDTSRNNVILDRWYMSYFLGDKKAEYDFHNCVEGDGNLDLCVSTSEYSHTNGQLKRIELMETDRINPFPVFEVIIEENGTIRKMKIPDGEGGGYGFGFSNDGDYTIYSCDRHVGRNLLDCSKIYEGDRIMTMEDLPSLQGFF
jgi:hypothetical protein